jgi:hypothetical protein
MTTRETIDGLVAVQHRARDPFPAITDAMLLALLERDTLSVLGIAT